MCLHNPNSSSSTSSPCSAIQKSCHSARPPPSTCWRHVLWESCTYSTCDMTRCVVVHHLSFDVARGHPPGRGAVALGRHAPLPAPAQYAMPGSEMLSGNCTAKPAAVSIEMGPPGQMPAQSYGTVHAGAPCVPSNQVVLDNLLRLRLPVLLPHH